MSAFNAWNTLLTIVVTSSILDLARIIGLPPNTSAIAHFHKTLYGELFALYVNNMSYLQFSLQHFKIHVQTYNLKHNM